MPRTFAYLRVSTAGQTTDNQLQEIKAAGFKVEPRRVIMETISGNVATSQRRGFTRLLDRVEPGGRAKRLSDYLSPQEGHGSTGTERLTAGSLCSCKVQEAMIIASD